MSGPRLPVPADELRSSPSPEIAGPPLPVPGPGATSPGASDGVGDFPAATPEQLRQAKAMLRAGHHPDSVEAFTRLPRERVAQLAHALRQSPRRRR